MTLAQERSYYGGGRAAVLWTAAPALSSHMFGLTDAYGNRALGRQEDKGLESITATGLGGKVANDEITVFCSDDSIISFVAFHHCKQKACTS